MRPRLLRGVGTEPSFVTYKISIKLFKLMTDRINAILDRAECPWDRVEGPLKDREKEDEGEKGDGHKYRDVHWAYTCILLSTNY